MAGTSKNGMGQMGGKRKGTRKNNMEQMGGKRKGTRKNNMEQMGGQKNMEQMGGKRKGTRKNNMNQMGGKRKASPWNKFVKKVYEEMKRKSKSATFGEALEEASRRKKKGGM
jgi:hypothetical protein